MKKSTDFSSIIPITINYNKKIYQSTADKRTSLQVFANTIIDSFNLLPMHYILKHENIPIEITDTRPLLSLQTSKDPLVFSIIKRSKDSNVTHKAMITPSIIKVENFLDYQAMINSIGVFLKTKKLALTNFTKNKNNTSISFMVPSLQIAHGFSDYITILSKMKNSMIGNAKVLIDENGYNKLNKHTSSINHNELKQKINDKSISSIDYSKKMLKGNRSVTLPPVKILTTINATPKSEMKKNSRYESNQCNTYATPEENHHYKKNIDEFYSQQEFTRLSSPFVEQYDLKMKQYHQDKKNWLERNGFYTSVGKYSMKGGLQFIPNYVCQDPSEPAINHQFRNIHKNQWIDKKGFMLC